MLAHEALVSYEKWEEENVEEEEKKGVSQDEKEGDEGRLRQLRRNQRHRRCYSRWALVAPPGVCEVWPLTLKMATYKEVACKAVP